MVSLFRSWRDGFEGAAARAETVRRAWQNHGCVPSADDLSQAATLLTELGIGPGGAEEATMMARDSAAYRAAEGIYQEALARCRRM
jgi:hypothetical protein